MGVKTDCLLVATQLWSSTDGNNIAFEEWKK